MCSGLSDRFEKCKLCMKAMFVWRTKVVKVNQNNQRNQTNTTNNNNSSTPAPVNPSQIFNNSNQPQSFHQG
ncbi:hypothetical protein GQ42DRAFT_165973 [Ramicandelaber brevisporus]|nr:hypothetical protein GQ42DRAFT_165973 [Ramicandelaber brevisporus]